MILLNRSDSSLAKTSQQHKVLREGQANDGGEISNAAASSRGGVSDLPLSFCCNREQHGS